MALESEDIELFVRLFSRSQLKILGFIQMLVPSPTEAEDILQETSVILWAKWDQYDRSRDFASWACGVARLEVFRFLRKRKQKVYLSESLLQSIGDLAMRDLRSQEDDQLRQEALSNCIEALKPAEQNLLDERYRNAKDVAWIAEQKSVSVRAIYKKLITVRGKLRRCIELRLGGNH